MQKCSVSTAVLIVLISWNPAGSYADAGDSSAVLRDTTTEAQNPAMAAHSPRGAVLRAAILPGWGQYYNRQPYKIPFVYGALGGLTGLLVLLNDEYILFRRVYLYMVDPATYGHYGEIIPGRLQPVIDSNRDDLVRSHRDALRRNRDLTVLGLSFAYAFSILDAYVSAHLIDFDVGEDLTLRPISGPHGIMMSLKLQF